MFGFVCWTENPEGLKPIRTGAGIGFTNGVIEMISLIAGRTMLHPDAGARIANGGLTIRAAAGGLHADVPLEAKALITLSTTKRTLSRTPSPLCTGPVDTAALERNTVVALQPIAFQAARTSKRAVYRALRAKRSVTMLAHTDIAHALGILEMVALITTAAGVPAMLQARQLWVNDPISADTFVRYTDAVFDVESLITLHAECALMLGT